jgi:hypothetical protein
MYQEQDIVRIAKRLTAGGTLFPMPSPMNDYRAYVERMLPRLLPKTDLTGTLVKGIINWKNEYNTGIQGEVAHYFTFELLPAEGPDTVHCEGKVSARFIDGGIAVRLMIYD